MHARTGTTVGVCLRRSIGALGRPQLVRSAVTALRNLPARHAVPPVDGMATGLPRCMPHHPLAPCHGTRAVVASTLGRSLLYDPGRVNRLSRGGWCCAGGNRPAQTSECTRRHRHAGGWHGRQHAPAQLLLESVDRYRGRVGLWCRGSGLGLRNNACPRRPLNRTWKNGWSVVGSNYPG